MLRVPWILLSANFASLSAMPVDGAVRLVPQRLLAVSEPDPSLFGNGPNSNDPAWSNGNWLKSRFHFSFAEYSNPRNQNFGVLRVMNDDLVQPHRGFGMHGHRDAEICTYVVDGELTHADSMGTKETLKGGAIQFMTAGRGVRHSEHNLGAKPLRFIQMWLTPRRSGLPPSYGSFPGDVGARADAWHHMVSDVQDASSDTPVAVNTDVNMHATELGPASELPLDVAEGRQAYLLCIDGNAELTDRAEDKRRPCRAGVKLTRHDAAEMVGPVKLQVTGPAHLLLVEMAHDPRSDGRGDLRGGRASASATGRESCSIA